MAEIQKKVQDVIAKLEMRMARYLKARQMMQLKFNNSAKRKIS
jgi:hypothetical protein